ncbi:MAG: hypothetical protein ACFCU5_15025 [Pleurocapsa sp.]
MDNPSQGDRLLMEFQTERSIRRVAQLLQDKRSRIRDDLQQLIDHLSLFVPQAAPTDNNRVVNNTDILLEAAHRLNDEIFTELLVQIIQTRRK